MTNKMNAIQYFDWGGNGGSIPFCTIRAKDFFATQKGRDVERFVPIPFRYRSELSIGVNPYRARDISINKKFDYIREGNDLVCKTYINKNISESRDLSGLVFTSKFLDSSNTVFDKELYGYAYIEGRKINISAVIFTDRLVYFNLDTVFMDNNERLTLQGALGKEIIIKDYYNI